VAAQDEVPVEREEQVLPDRLDALQLVAVDPLGDAQELRARVRRFGRHDVSDERLEPGRGAVERVSLGHG
jgi:hypothetical protein